MFCCCHSKKVHTLRLITKFNTIVWPRQELEVDHLRMSHLTFVGIIARLLSTPGVEVVGSRMYAPNEQFQKDWVNILKQTEVEVTPDGNSQHDYEEVSSSTQVRLSH